MTNRVVACAAFLLAAACNLDNGTSVSPAVITQVTLGPAVATESYRPSGLPAAWTGFCPVASPSTVTFTAGNGYQIVNKSDRAVEIVTLPGRISKETIPAGAAGTQVVDFGAVSQASFSYTLTVTGCTDTVSQQGLLNVIVNSK